MNKKVNPTLIGTFVLGATALLIVGIVIFGSGRLFRDTFEAVLYFEGSVNGLREGAPVRLLGVEIGSVSRLLLRLGPETKVGTIPVIIEIDRDKIASRGFAGKINERQALRAAVDQGLRARLETESFVTGVLFVSLDFYPGTPAEFLQPPDSRTIEIPTIPTAFQKAQTAASRILERLEIVDFERFVSTATDLLRSTQALVENPDLQETLAGINRLVNDPELRTVVKSLDTTVKQLNGTIEKFDNLALHLSGSASDLTADARRTLAAAREALGQITATTITLQSAVEADSPAMYELRNALREVSAAARSLRLMADLVERNPRALLFGRRDGEVAR